LRLTRYNDPLDTLYVITSGVRTRSYTTRIGRIREQEEEDIIRHFRDDTCLDPTGGALEEGG